MDGKEGGAKGDGQALKGGLRAAVDVYSAVWWMWRTETVGCLPFACGGKEVENDGAGVALRMWVAG